MALLEGIRNEERGAGLVEFALVFPLLMVVLTGIITGGIALNQSISTNNAAREAARYGATLPLDADMSTWLHDVADVAIGAASGELDDGVPGRRVCVAFVHPDGTDPIDQTTQITVDEAGVRTVSVGTPCYVDGRPNSERRIQVSVERTSEVEIVLWSRTVTLDGESTARFERAGF